MRNIVVLGDWHRNYRWATGVLRGFRERNTTPDIYLHVGDFGLYKNSHAFISLVNQELKLQNRELWFIDGNHEGFDVLDNLEYDSRGLQKVTNHIFRIPRGYSWTWSGKKFVALGGAFSVNKRFLKEGVSWFPQEVITESDLLKAKDNVEADILISHEAPIFNEFLFNRSPIDFKLTDEEDYLSRICRDRVLEAIRSLNIKLNIHGHHHVKYKAGVDGCQVIGLGADRGFIGDNFVRLDLSKDFGKIKE